jgi:hypothetical protein
MEFLYPYVFIRAMHNIVFLWEWCVTRGCGVEDQEKKKKSFVAVKQLYTLVQWKIISRNGI